VAERYREAGEQTRPALPVVENLIATHPNDLALIRTGANFASCYGVMMLDHAAEIPDDQLDHVLRAGLAWDEQLMAVDPEDRRSRRMAADMRSLLGIFEARTNPQRGAELLRQSVQTYIDELRLSPAHLDLTAQLVEFGSRLVEIEVRRGREQQAVAELRPVLESYDPLSLLGLK